MTETVNQGIKTYEVSAHAIMRTLAFRLGYDDYVAGISFPRNVDDHLRDNGAWSGGDWDYERGRLYAAAGGERVTLTPSRKFVDRNQARFFTCEDAIL